MKKASILGLIALLAIIISSCGSSNNVVSNHSISKRKYNKGFFFNRNSNFKSSEAKVKEAEVKEDKSIAKAERVEARKERKAEKEMEREMTLAVSDDMNGVEPMSNLMVDEETRANPRPNALFHDEVDGIDWSVTENEASTRESIEEMTSSTRKNTADQKSSSSRGGSSGGMTVLLVILALIIPPLAVFIFEGATQRFWIDLILLLVGVGIGIGLSGIAYIAAVAAVVYALLIVLGVI